MYQIVESANNPIDVVGLGCVRFDEFESLITGEELYDEFIIQVRKSYDNILYNLSLDDARKRCEEGKYKDDISGTIVSRIDRVREDMESIDTKDLDIDGCIIAKFGDIEEVSDFTSSLSIDPEDYAVLFGGIDMHFGRVNKDNFDFLDVIEGESDEVFPTCQYCGNNREYDTAYSFERNNYDLCEKCVRDIREVCAKINGNKKILSEITLDKI